LIGYCYAYKYAAVEIAYKIEIIAPREACGLKVLDFTAILLFDMFYVGTT
jgi:hypothetical protein